MTAAGFTLAGADHAIIPVMLGEAKLAQEFANALLKEGIYVTGFFYPVVPKGRRASVPRCLPTTPRSKSNAQWRRLHVSVRILALLHKVKP